MRSTTSEARRIRAALLERRTKLLARYRSELARADEELAQHPADVIDIASDRWDANVLGQLGESDRAALAAIDAALARLARGGYGICARCGGRITKGRLYALPEAVECEDCASFAELRVPRFTHRVG